MMKKLNWLFLIFIFFISISGFAAEPSSGGGLLEAIGLVPQTILLQVLGFLVVLLILWKFVFGRVGGLLEERQYEINSRMSKLEADQQELDRLNAETRQRLSEIESESQQKIQAAIDEGNEERQSILAQTRLDANAELERARAEIQREKEEAILEVRGIVAEVAIDAASQIIDQKLDVQGHQHIIDEYLRRIPDAPSQN